MHPTDSSAHCDCREVSARRVQIGSFLVLLAAGLAYGYFAWQRDVVAANVANLGTGLAVMASGIAGLCRRGAIFRTVGWLSVALGLLIVLFDLWLLFLR